MFDALVVTPIRIFFVLIFIGTAYTFVFRRTWDKWRMERIQRKPVRPRRSSPASAPAARKRWTS
jgi:hypothetical protein